LGPRQQRPAATVVTGGHREFHVGLAGARVTEQGAELTQELVDWRDDGDTRMNGRPAAGEGSKAV